jgi:hypothetical protein
MAYRGVHEFSVLLQNGGAVAPGGASPSFARTLLHKSSWIRERAPVRAHAQPYPPHFCHHACMHCTWRCLGCLSAAHAFISGILKK